MNTIFDVERKILVRPASSIQSIDELFLKEDTYKHLTGYPVDELILCSRRGCLDEFLRESRKNEGAVYDYENEGPYRPISREAHICRETAKDFRETLEMAGFIRHDFEDYLKSFNLMSLVRVIESGVLQDHCCNDRANIQREVARFNNEKYETFCGLSPEREEYYLETLKHIVSRKQYAIIKLRFGQRYSGCLSREKVAEIMDMSVSGIRYNEEAVIRKMQGQFDPNFVREDLGEIERKRNAFDEVSGR